MGTNSTYDPTKPDLPSLVRRVLPDGIQNLLLSVGRFSHNRGVPVYLVGGVVRDLLLEVPNLDIDLVVEGDGLKFARELAKKLGAEVELHHPFLTATLILPEGLRVDIATARTEEYVEAAALPKVQPAAIEDDLARRDFTINSLALRIGERGAGELLDPFDGSEDLKNGVIRVLHPKSFIDDPTRAFRAVRYQTRFGFSLERSTLKFLKNAVSSGMIERLSGERIRNELWLILAEEKAGKALQTLASLEVLSHIHQDLAHTSSVTEMLAVLRRSFSKFKGKLGFDAGFVSLLPLLENTDFDRSLEIGKRLSLTKREMQKIVQLKLYLGKLGELSREELKPSQTTAILRNLSSELLVFMAARTENPLVRERIQSYVDSYRRVKLSITGDDLKALGIPEGPAYKEILDGVLEAKLDGLVGTEEEELQLARKLYQKKQ